jgi:NADH-quinone oxidoreductase subunit A
LEAAYPIFVFLAAGAAIAVVTLVAGGLFSPKRRSSVKDMPYESGMDPFHDTQRRFDIRFHLVAIAFLVFDVEILFLYPWAVAMNHPEGIEAVTQASATAPDGVCRGLVLAGAGFFALLLFLGWLYDWRKGVFKWR